MADGVIPAFPKIIKELSHFASSMAIANFLCQSYKKEERHYIDFSQFYYPVDNIK